MTAYVVLRAAAARLDVEARIAHRGTATVLEIAAGRPCVVRAVAGYKLATGLAEAHG